VEAGFVGQVVHAALSALVRYGAEAVTETGRIAGLTAPARPSGTTNASAWSTRAEPEALDAR